MIREHQVIPHSSLSRFLLFSLFSFFYLFLLLFFFHFFFRTIRPPFVVTPPWFRTIRPPFVVTPPWSSTRPTRSVVFFFSSLYFVELCKCFLEAFLFFLLSFANSGETIVLLSSLPLFYRYSMVVQERCRHHSPLDPSLVALGPLFTFIFFSSFFLFCTFVPPPPSGRYPHGGLTPQDLALVASQAARQWFPLWVCCFLRDATRVFQPCCVIASWAGSP